MFVTPVGIRRLCLFLWLQVGSESHVIECSLYASGKDGDVNERGLVRVSRIFAEPASLNIDNCDLQRASTALSL